MILHDRDYQVILTGIVLALITGALAQLGILTVQQEMLAGYFAAAPVPFAIYFIYRARSLWGGEIARNLEIIGIGLGIQLLTYVPHLYWHLTEVTAGTLPVWGISTHFWYMFFHGLSALSFGLMAYGFYQFRE